ncbi:DUF3054 domain-containing protein [Microbacterium sp.]|uniref:DUF3054 domain-containing protein n=1 Tax=Microbacterium sp. TaxID=51671 RepID=UPI0039E4AA2E
MRYVPALIVDAVLVLVFAVIGRASHSEDPLGLFATAWPFLVALLVGHVVAAVQGRRAPRPWTILWGAIVWVVTVVGGLLLRVATGSTAEPPFIIVATLVLGLFLIGWRALAAVVRRRRRLAEGGAPARGVSDSGGAAGAGAASETGDTTAERDPDTAHERDQQ